MRAEHATLSGRDCLRVELAFPAPDGARRRTTLLMSGQGRTYEITFRYHSSLENEVYRDIEVVRRSFLLEGDKPKEFPARDALPLPPAPSSQQTIPASSRWFRVALWTVGAFCAGVLLHYVLQWLSRALGSREAKAGKSGDEQGE
jgi:hypothetical protein